MKNIGGVFSRANCLVAAVLSSMAVLAGCKTGAEAEPVEGLYLVIDLSGGPTAAAYPVSYCKAAPAGGWSEEYKTQKLILRYIPSGSFMMGAPTNEVGRIAKYEKEHAVTLTRPFYLGVFEITQRQWELVMGDRPSTFSGAAFYRTRPVEGVSFDRIRGASLGAKWPASNEVDTNSFIGRLRTKCNLAGCDLPTEAQWEYACRAGTISAFNHGGNLKTIGADPVIDAVGRYLHNNGFYENCGLEATCDTSMATGAVGSYAPNAWGLYDMHGNVWEWCLDWWTDVPGGETDPKGAVSGSRRSIRGGGWSSDCAQQCRSAYRSASFEPSQSGDFLGLRLAVSPAK